MNSEKFELMKLDPNKVVELDQWEVKLKTLVEENPFIKIEDKKTFEEAKKRRTALKSGRTEVQKQDGLIATFMTNFRKTTKANSDKLISIVEPHEKKQQDEIDRYQKILDDAKAEEQRLAELRRQGFLDKIEDSKKQLQSIIDHMKFETIEESKTSFFEFKNSVLENFDFEEFEFMFEEMVEQMIVEFDKQHDEVVKYEEIRIQTLKTQRRNQLNQMYLDAQSKIDAFEIVDEESNLIETIDDIFNTTFDPGELAEEMENSKKVYIQKALDKIDFLNKKAIDEMRNRIFDVREGLLDMIFQMTTEDFTSVSNEVMATLEQKFPEELKEDFEKMESMVKKSLEQKLNQIQIEIENEQNKRNLIVEERSKQLIEAGLIHDVENDNWSGFGLKYEVDEIWDSESIDYIFEEIELAKKEAVESENENEVVQASEAIEKTSEIEGNEAKTENIEGIEVNQVEEVGKDDEQSPLMVMREKKLLNEKCENVLEVIQNHSGVISEKFQKMEHEFFVKIISEIKDFQKSL